MTTAPATVRICQLCDQPARPGRKRCIRCQAAEEARRKADHAAASVITCPYCELPHNQHVHCSACGFNIGADPHPPQLRPSATPGLCVGCATMREIRRLIARGWV